MNLTFPIADWLFGTSDLVPRPYRPRCSTATRRVPKPQLARQAVVGLTKRPKAPVGTN